MRRPAPTDALLFTLLGLALWVSLLACSSGPPVQPEQPPAYEAPTEGEAEEAPIGETATSPEAQAPGDGGPSLAETASWLERNITPLTATFSTSGGTQTERSFTAGADPCRSTFLTSHVYQDGSWLHRRVTIDFSRMGEVSFFRGNRDDRDRKFWDVQFHTMRKAPILPVQEEFLYHWTDSERHEKTSKAALVHMWVYEREDVDRIRAAFERMKELCKDEADDVF